MKKQIYQEKFTQAQVKTMNKYLDNFSHGLKMVCVGGVMFVSTIVGMLALSDSTPKYSEEYQHSRRVVAKLEDPELRAEFSDTSSIDEVFLSHKTYVENYDQKIKEEQSSPSNVFWGYLAKGIFLVEFGAMGIGATQAGFNGWRGNRIWKKVQHKGEGNDPYGFSEKCLIIVRKRFDDRYTSPLKSQIAKVQNFVSRLERKVTGIKE